MRGRRSLLRPASLLAVAVASPVAVRGLHAELRVGGGAQLEFRAAPPSDGLGLANRTAAPALKRIHVISVGRQGSCMAIDLIQHAGDGLPGLWEPLRRTSEGAGILTKPGSDFKRQQVRCLFSEDPSSPSSGCGGVNVMTTQVLDSLKNATAVPSHPPVVLKTTRIVNLGLLAEELSPEQLQGAKFVVLVRDPRAIWASFKPFEGWAIHSIPLVCRLLAESLLTVPALADAAPGRVEVVMYEEWSKDLARFAERMGAFLGQDSAGMVRFGRERQRELGAPGWVSSLTAREVSYIERDRFCRAYMDRVGYRPGGAEGADYSGLRSSADLQRGLLPSEQSLLAELMSIQEFNPNMSPILKRA